MRRLTLSASVTLIVSLILALPAQARLTWCRSDPIVSLDGVHVRILVAIPEEYQRHVTGPVRVEVVTAGSVEREVLLTDEGFNGFGEQVIFTDLRGDPGTEEWFPALVRVKVPISEPALDERPHVPVLVEVITGSAKARNVRGTSELTALGFAVRTQHEAETPGDSRGHADGTGDSASPGVPDPDATDPFEPEGEVSSDPVAEADAAGSENTPVPTTP